MTITFRRYASAPLSAGWFIALLFCVAFTVSATAQEKKFTVRDRLYFGGSFGFSVGPYTDIAVSPIAGYYITPRWSAGVGVSYEYYNNKYHWQTQTGWERYETHIWGGSLFTNYVIVHDVGEWIPLGMNFRIFAHAEYEALSYKKGFSKYQATGRRLQNSLLAGGGLRFPKGRRSSMDLMFLWNLNSDMNDIYGNGPILRFGYNF